MQYAKTGWTVFNWLSSIWNWVTSIRTGEIFDNINKILAVILTGVIISTIVQDDGGTGIIIPMINSWNTSTIGDVQFMATSLACPNGYSKFQTTFSSTTGSTFLISNWKSNQICSISNGTRALVRPTFNQCASASGTPCSSVTCERNGFACPMTNITNVNGTFTAARMNNTFPLLKFKLSNESEAEIQQKDPFSYIVDTISEFDLFGGNNISNNIPRTYNSTWKLVAVSEGGWDLGNCVKARNDLFPSFTPLGESVSTIIHQRALQLPWSFLNPSLFLLF